MSSGKWTIIALLAIFVAFGGGYLTAYLPARQTAGELEASVAAAQAETQRTKDELQKAQLGLQMADLMGKLGQVYIDVNSNNFGMAAEKVTPFFDGLATFLESDPSLTNEQAQALRGILSRRDEIVTDLARANPQVRKKVGEMFSLLHARLSN